LAEPAEIENFPKTTNTADLDEVPLHGSLSRRERECEREREGDV